MTLATVAKKLFAFAFKKQEPFQNEFHQYIYNRNQKFWKVADSESIRYIQNKATDSIEVWKKEPMWQRKLSNKANSREFALKFGCQVPELYWKGDDLSKLDFSKLPAHYVVRPTIGLSSKDVFLMSNGLNLFDQKMYEPEELRTVLSEIVSKRAGLEVLIEEFLQPEEGKHDILTDYKLYMFNGEVAIIHVIQRKGRNKGYGNFYDEHWNPVENIRTYYPKGELIPKPKCFDQMVADAKRLSKAYEIFARIDFYATPAGAVFGEFTPTPAMGRGFTDDGAKMLVDYWNRFTPDKY